MTKAKFWTIYSIAIVGIMAMILVPVYFLSRNSGEPIYNFFSLIFIFFILIGQGIYIGVRRAYSKYFEDYKYDKHLKEMKKMHWLLILILQPFSMMVMFTGIALGYYEMIQGDHILWGVLALVIGFIAAYFYLKLMKQLFAKILF